MPRRVSAAGFTVSECTPRTYVVGDRRRLSFSCASPATPPDAVESSDLAENRRDDAEDAGLVAVDRLVGVVVGQQPDVPVLALQRLHGGLAVDQRRDDLAVVSG